MSSGFGAIWESHDADTTLKSWLNEFSASGWALVNPVTRASVRLDQMGEDVPIGHPRELSEVVRQEGVVTLHLWRDPDTDLGWALHQLDVTLHKAWVTFSGQSAQTRAQVVDMLVSRFRHLSIAGVATGLVVDQGGDSAEFDWDEFMLGRGGMPPYLPDYVLGVRADLAQRVRSEARIGHEEQVGGCVLLYPA